MQIYAWGLIGIQLVARCELIRGWRWGGGWAAAGGAGALRADRETPRRKVVGGRARGGGDLPAMFSALPPVTSPPTNAENQKCCLLGRASCGRLNSEKERLRRLPPRARAPKSIAAEKDSSPGDQHAPSHGPIKEDYPFV